MPFNCCEITDNAFSEAEAHADMKNYRRKGPANQTKLILVAIRSLGLKNADLLDIGGGIGAIHHELLEDVADKATDVDAELPKADIVTLDRVVCCYPNFRGLLKAAAEHSRSAVALTYPRETWYMRVASRVINFFQGLRQDPFRVFLHPVAEMDSLLKGEGFERVSLRRLFVWEMSFYRKKRAMV